MISKCGNIFSVNWVRFSLTVLLRPISKDCGKCKYHHHHHQSVLPKDRSFTANSGTKAAVLPKGRSSTATQEPRLQFY